MQVNGTTDLSILDCSDGVFEVLSTNGNSLLGGKDIDEAIVKEIIEYGKKEFGIDFSKDTQALQRITEAAEKAKCELSSAMTSNINLPFISMNENGPVHLNYDLSRANFEKLVSNVYDKIEENAKKCVEDSGISYDKITDVILVGGTTRIPYIQELTKKVFHKLTVNKDINPDECVRTRSCYSRRGACWRFWNRRYSFIRCLSNELWYWNRRWYYG